MSSEDYRKALPEERVPPATGRAVWRTALSVLVIVSAFNVLARWYLRHYSPNPGYRIVQESWDMLLDSKGRAETLILGDSSGACGVVPQVLDEQLGTVSRNYCLIGDALPLSDAWMLEEYISRHGPPKRVLIVHVYDVWSRPISDDCRAVLSKFPLPWGYWRDLRPELTLSPKEELQIVLGRYLPLYAENRSMAALLRFPWKIVTIPLNSGDHRKIGYRPVAGADPTNVEKEARGHLTRKREGTTVLSPHSLRSIAQVSALAETHGFDVYYADAPLYEGLASNADFMRHYRTIQAAVRAAISRNDRLHHIPKTPLTYPKEQMQNCDHVVGKAAEDYTRRLARAIQRHPVAQKD